MGIVEVTRDTLYVSFFKKKILSVSVHACVCVDVHMLCGMGVDVRG